MTPRTVRTASLAVHAAPTGDQAKFQRRAKRCGGIVSSKISSIAREITIYMGVKLFDKPHIAQEHNLFGPRFGRDFGKVF